MKRFFSFSLATLLCCLLERVDAKFVWFTFDGGDGRSLNITTEGITLTVDNPQSTSEPDIGLGGWYGLCIYGNNCQQGSLESIDFTFDSPVQLIGYYIEYMDDSGGNSIKFGTESGKVSIQTSDQFYGGRYGYFNNQFAVDAGETIQISNGGGDFQDSDEVDLTQLLVSTDADTNQAIFLLDGAREATILEKTSNGVTLTVSYNNLNSDSLASWGGPISDYGIMLAYSDRDGNSTFDSVELSFDHDVVLKQFLVGTNSYEEANNLSLTFSNSDGVSTTETNFCYESCWNYYPIETIGDQFQDFSTALSVTSTEPVVVTSSTQSGPQSFQESEFRAYAIVVEVVLPTAAPTQSPSVKPTARPTAQPTAAPTAEPTAMTTTPTLKPTLRPTLEPSPEPTAFPTTVPTVSPAALTVTRISSGFSRVSASIHGITATFGGTELISASRVTTFETVVDDWFKDHYTNEKFNGTLKDFRSRISVRRQEAVDALNRITFDQQLDYLAAIGEMQPENIAYPYNDYPAVGRLLVNLKASVPAFQNTTGLISVNSSPANATSSPPKVPSEDPNSQSSKPPKFVSSTVEGIQAVFANTTLIYEEQISAFQTILNNWFKSYYIAKNESSFFAETNIESNIVVTSQRMSDMSTAVVYDQQLEYMLGGGAVHRPPESIALEPYSDPEAVTELVDTLQGSVPAFEKTTGIVSVSILPSSKETETTTSWGSLAGAFAVGAGSTMVLVAIVACVCHYREEKYKEETSLFQESALTNHS